MSCGILPRNKTTEIIRQNCQVWRAEWLAKIPPYFTSWEFDFWLRLTAWQENNELDIEWERESSGGGRWSSEHKDVELIARVSLNVWHWLLRLPQPNRGSLVHAFAMKPLAGCAACGRGEKPFPHEWDSWDWRCCYALRASSAVPWCRAGKREKEREKSWTLLNASFGAVITIQNKSTSQYAFSLQDGHELQKAMEAAVTHNIK